MVGLCNLCQAFLPRSWHQCLTVRRQYGAAGAAQVLGAAAAPLDQLQATFDEVLVRLEVGASKMITRSS